MGDHGQGSDSTPTFSKSAQSSLKSDSLDIDLGITKTKNEIRKCEHFSLREYVSEMRKKNGNICFPFASDGNIGNLEQKLPPMHAPKFRWWCCENSIQESGGANCSLETSFVSKYSKTGQISVSICTPSPLKNDEIVHPDVQKGPERDKSDGRKVDECTSLYNVDKKDMKTKVGPVVADSDHESGLDNDDIQEITRADYDLARDKKRHQERHLDDQDDVEPKSIGLIEKCVPISENQDDADNILKIQYNNCKANSSTEACIRKEFDSMNVELRNVFPNCKAGSKESSKFNKAITSFGGQLVRHPLDRGNPSPKNEGNLARNNHLDQQDDSSRGFPRRKTRKMRLVADLLGGNGNLENNHLRTVGSPFDSISNVPSTLASISAPEANAKIHDSIGNVVKVPRRKTKMSNDQERKYMDHTNVQNSCEVVKSSMEDAETRIKAIEISDSKWEENVDGAVVYNRFKRHWSGRERSSFVSRKSMPTQNGDEQLCSKPWPEVTRQINHTTLGDASNTAIDTHGFTKSNHASIKSRGMEQFMNGSVPLKQKKRSSTSTKKTRTLQVKDVKTFSRPLTNHMPREGSIKRKDIETSGTRSEEQKMWLEHDVCANIGRDLSLSNHIHSDSNEKDHAKLEGGIIPFIHMQNGIHHKDFERKDSSDAGESSVSLRNSTSDPPSKDGLLRNVSEKMAQKIERLRKQRNDCHQPSDGSCSLREKMDFFDPSNINENQNGNQGPPKALTEGISDEIMEIVEFMAKLQYERSCSESKNDKSKESTVSVISSRLQHTENIQRPASGFTSQVIVDVEQEQDRTKYPRLLASAYNRGCRLEKSPIRQNGCCTINRNPADFSPLEAAAGSEHMISGEDLQCRRKIRSGGKSVLENSNGRKKPRVTKTTRADAGVQ